MRHLWWNQHVLRCSYIPPSLLCDQPHYPLLSCLPSINFPTSNQSDTADFCYFFPHSLVSSIPQALVPSACLPRALFYYGNVGRQTLPSIPLHGPFPRHLPISHPDWGRNNVNLTWWRYFFNCKSKSSFQGYPYYKQIVWLQCLTYEIRWMTNHFS